MVLESNFPMRNFFVTFLRVSNAYFPINSYKYHIKSSINETPTGYKRYTHWVKRETETSIIRYITNVGE